MSASDADVVELALEALYALDKLLHLIASRKNYLELLAARVDWEEQRAASWECYYELAEEVEECVRTSQWTDDQARCARNTTLRPSKDKEEAAAAGCAARRQAAEARTARLRSRIAAWGSGPVAAAGQAMDALIDIEQMPEELLDEQDRLENQVDLLGGQLDFLDQLTRQWQAADELLSSIRALQEDALRIRASAKLEAGYEQHSLRRLFELLQAQATSAQDALGALCGREPAAAFLADPTHSPRALRLAPEHQHLLETSHPKWSAQRERNAKVSSVVHDGLVVSAKSVRQACDDVRRLGEAMRSLDAFAREIEAARVTLDRLDTAQAAYKETVRALQDAALAEPDLFATSAGSPHQAALDSAMSVIANTLTSAEHSVYTLDAARRQAQAQAVPTSLLSQCEGPVAHDLARLLREVKLRQTEGTLLASSIEALVSASGACSEARPIVDELARQLGDLSADILEDSVQLQQREEQIRALPPQPAAFTACLLKLETRSPAPGLEPCHDWTISTLRSLRVEAAANADRHAWEHRRLAQARQAQGLAGEIKTLLLEGEQAIAAKKVSETVDLSRRIDLVLDGAAARIDFIGPPSVLLISQESKPDTPTSCDDAVRKYCNDWCSRLRSLQQQLSDSKQRETPSLAGLPARYFTAPVVPASKARDKSSNASSKTGSPASKSAALPGSAHPRTPLLTLSPPRANTRSVSAPGSARRAAEDGARSVVRRAFNSPNKPSVQSSRMFATPRKQSGGRADPGARQTISSPPKPAPLSKRWPSKPAPRDSPSRVSSATSTASSASRSSSGKRTYMRPYSENSNRCTNPESELDRAISEVVKGLPVAVSLQVSSEPRVSRSSGWHDETAQYLLSDPSSPERPAKLIFCRILRSRKVMVRIGGGWQGLADFICDNFEGDVAIQRKPSSAAARQTSATYENADTSFEPILLTPSSSRTRISSLPPSHSSSSLVTPAKEPLLSLSASRSFKDLSKAMDSIRFPMPREASNSSIPAPTFSSPTKRSR